MFDGPVRGGTRGGQAEFKWTDVSADKDREHYLGHSINAPTGRWQKNKDVHWYNRDKQDTEEERLEEIRRVKEAEAEALAVALGFKPAPKPGQTAQTTTAITEDETKPKEIEDVAASEERKREREKKRRQKKEKRAMKELKRAKKLERRRLKDHPQSDEGHDSRYHRRTLSRSYSPPSPRREKGRIRSTSSHRSRSPDYRHHDRTAKGRSRSRSLERRRFSDGHRDQPGRRIEPVDRSYRR